MKISWICFYEQVGISAEASRALGARRAIRKLSGFEEAMDIGELFQRLTGTNMKDAKAQADLFASLENPAEIARMAQKTREANWKDYAIAYRNTISFRPGDASAFRRRQYD